ncbi:uncharacterized protein LOC133780443 [Humulus lupulus]|uniref:uncharacterized protein LOC133780443 n=1 Tax=Humulus lupulus TaxID=3486 RepID=UPI002B40FD80|nr:uncharacterized protein LOC133780443 [Humulus lupulus]
MGLALKSVEKMVPLCVTLVKNDCLGSSSASPSVNKEVRFEVIISPQCHCFRGTQSEVGKFVLGTNPDVIVHDDIPVRGPPHDPDIAEYERYDYDPYVNDDLVANGSEVDGPDIRADLPNHSLDVIIVEERRRKNRQTHGTSSNRQGLGGTKENNIWSSPLDIGEGRRTWSAPMFMKEDIEA